MIALSEWFICIYTGWVLLNFLIYAIKFSLCPNLCFPFRNFVYILRFHWCYLHVFKFFSPSSSIVLVWILSTEWSFFLSSVVLICYQVSSMNFFNNKRHSRFLVLEFSFVSLESFHFLARNILVIYNFHINHCMYSQDLKVFASFNNWVIHWPTLLTMFSFDYISHFLTLSHLTYLNFLTLIV